jgi:aromatic ring-opening dioxygenase catalytic subunit (LigB family)
MKKLPKIVFKYPLKTKQRVVLTTHFATHHEKSVDLKEKNNAFYSFNPFVVGSTPAGPTKNLKKDLE